MELCFLCIKDIWVGEVVTLRQKGAGSINKASVLAVIIKPV